MTSALRLLVCSPGVPHESRGASSVLYYHYIEGFKRAGFEVLNVLLLERDVHEDALAEYSSKLAEPRKFSIASVRAERLVVPRRTGFTLAPGVASEVERQASGFHPDVACYMDLVSAWAGTEVRCAGKLAWLGDLHFQTQWYHAWYSVREKAATAVRLPLALLRSQRWKAIYRKVLSGMDSVIVSSKLSERHLTALGVASRYLPYPWPAPPAVGPSSGRSRPSFVFMGGLGALGSRSAFHFMIWGLYSRLLRLWGPRGFEILICGSGTLPEWVRQALETRPEFVHLGFVEDLSKLVGSCHALIVPIDVPVGNRSRILTAMAMGMLVIAHRNTALGNPDLVDGATCYLARDIGEFVDRMRRAVERADEAIAVVTRARECYERRFHPTVAVAAMVDEVRRIAVPSAVAIRPVGAPS